MSDSAEWVVLFRAKKLPALDEVLVTAKSVPGIHAHVEHGDVLANDEETGIVLRITANGAPVVREESAELAGQAETTDADEVRACNARFEITWSLEDSAEVTNPLCLVAEALSRLVGGRTFIYDPEAGEFIE